MVLTEDVERSLPLVRLELILAFVIERGDHFCYGLLCVGAFLPEAGSNIGEASYIEYLQGNKQAPQECYFIDAGGVLLQAAPEAR